VGKTIGFASKGGGFVIAVWGGGEAQRKLSVKSMVMTVNKIVRRNERRGEGLAGSRRKTARKDIGETRRNDALEKRGGPKNGRDRWRVD